MAMSMAISHRQPATHPAPHCPLQVPEAVSCRMRAMFLDEVLSPADLETMCADHETCEELCSHIEGHFRGMLHHKMS